MAWQQVLADKDVTVAVVDADHVLLFDLANSVRNELPSRLIQSPAPLYPSRILKWANSPRTLLVVPTASEATVRAARSIGWDVVAEDGTVDVRLGSRHVASRATKDAERPQKRRQGPVPRSKFTLGRVLLAQQRPVSQSELARKAGVSQPTASRACAEFAARGFVGSGDGVAVTDWFAMARWWLSSYPGTGGPSSYWFGLEPIMTQVQAASKSLPGAVFSGSAAADLLTPWQRPDAVVAYTKSPALLEDAGFVPVSDPSAATLVVTAPADTSVWAHRPIERATNGELVALADPLQVAFDVLNGPDSGTRAEVADRLLQDLHGPLRSAWAKSWELDADR